MMLSQRLAVSLSRGFLLVEIVVAALASTAHAASIADSLTFVQSSTDYVEINESDGVAIDLRYASTNNFVGKNMYGEFNRAYLHRITAEKLKNAVNNLQAVYPRYKIVIFDGLRPRSVQHLLWDQVKGTDKQSYVANPQGGSIHNYGFALDISVLDEEGKELDMGTPYDDFTAVSQPRHEAKYLNEGKLTEKQINNRLILRKAMEDAGFIQLPVEWWHFDALPKAEVRGTYKIVE